MRYKHADQVRLEVDASDVTNLISNHSAQGGATTGWLAGTGVTLAASTNPTRSGETLLGTYTGGKCLKATYGGTASAGSEVLSPSVAVVAGEVVGVTFSVADSRVVVAGAELHVNVGFVFYDGGGVALATAASAPPYAVLGGDSPWQMVQVVNHSEATAPAGTASVRVKWTFANNAAMTTKITRDVYLAKVMLVSSLGADASLAVLDVPFSDTTVWQDVIGSATSAHIVRGGEVNGVTDDLTPGTLTATVTDPIMDPAQNSRMRVGRQVRVTALDSSAVWRAIYTGRVDTLDVTYADKHDPSAAPTIVLTAVDAIAEMAKTNQPFNYAGAYGPKVKAIMGTSTIPYVADAGTASTDINHRDRDNGKLWDQLILARNSFSGAQLWVDADGTLQAVTVASTGVGAYEFTDRVPAAFSNSVTNPSYESGTTGAGVIGTGAAVAQSAVWAEQGTKSLLVSKSSATVQTFTVDTVTTDGTQGQMLLAQGDYFSARIAVRMIVSGGSQLKLLAQEYNGAVAVGSSYLLDVVTSPAAGVTTVIEAAHLQLTQPTATKVRVWMAVTLPVATGSMFYVDGWCQIKEGATSAGWDTVPYADTSGVWTPAATPYTEVEVNYGSGVLCNELMVTLNNDGELDGAKQYGPYQNATSIADWGQASAELEAVDGVPSTLAAAFLARYATPAIFPRSVGFRWQDAYGDAIFTDLYDEVRILHHPSDTAEVVTVLGVEHTITPKRWDVSLRLRPEDTSAVTVTNPAAGADTGPDDVAGSGRSGPFTSIQLCTAAYTVTASAVDVTGMTTTVEVLNSAEVFDVAIQLDVQTLTTGAGTFVGRLMIDGVEDTHQAIWVAPATTGARSQVCGVWRVTGLAAGNRVIKVRASATTASVYRINATHSVLRISQVN